MTIEKEKEFEAIMTRKKALKTAFPSRSFEQFEAGIGVLKDMESLSERYPDDTEILKQKGYMHYNIAYWYYTKYYDAGVSVAFENSFDSSRAPKKSVSYGFEMLERAVHHLKKSLDISLQREATEDIEGDLKFLHEVIENHAISLAENQTTRLKLKKTLDEYSSRAQQILGNGR